MYKYNKFVLRVFFSQQFIFIDKEMPQVLYPEELNIKISSIGGFGYTFSKKGTNIDSNNYNDFGIGAPFDNKAIIMKTRQAFEFKSVVTFSNYETSIDPKVKGENYVFIIHLEVLQ